MRVVFVLVLFAVLSAVAKSQEAEKVDAFAALQDLASTIEKSVETFKAMIVINHGHGETSEGAESANLRGSDGGRTSRRLYNIYKSYAESKSAAKPPQYSKKENKKHDISEYLSKDQKRMKEGREGTGEYFDGKWSGYTQYKDLRKERKAKADKGGDRKAIKEFTDKTLKVAASDAAVQTASLRKSRDAR